MQLTLRDQDILIKLADYGMFSTRQIRERFFNDANVSTVLRRLRILEEERLIKRVMGAAGQELIWLITPLGAEKMNIAHFRRGLNLNLLDHDFKLLEVRIFLEKEGMIKNWHNDHILKSKYGQKKVRFDDEQIIPDAIVLTKETKNARSYALELELTLKNLGRLRKILKAYKLKKGISAVIYIVSSPTIKKALLREWRELASIKTEMKLFVLFLKDLFLNSSGPCVFIAEGECPIRDIFPVLGAHSPAHRVSTLSESQLLSNGPITVKNHSHQLEFCS